MLLIDEPGTYLHARAQQDVLHLLEDRLSRKDQIVYYAQHVSNSWRQDEWNGSSERPAVSVQAGSFEQAKADMELALAKHIQALLERSGTAAEGQAA
jgi:hypothetical protein